MFLQSQWTGLPSASSPSGIRGSSRERSASMMARRVGLRAGEQDVLFLIFDHEAVSFPVGSRYPYVGIGKVPERRFFSPVA